MKHKIFIVTFLLGNMAFGAIVPVGVLRANTQIRQLSSTTALASLHLYKKGLDKKTASKKINNILQDDDMLSDLMCKNIINGIDGVSQADIIRYISSAALFEKQIDLGSYATLVSLAQLSVSEPLSKAVLQKIEAVAGQNSNLRASFIQTG